MTRPDESPLLSLRHIGKSFPGIRALADVSLDVRAGEVHALMGENGAGKSTLMRILAGLHRPDSGEVWLAGHPVDIGNPHRARELGIAMIHQELMPFPALSVAENIFAGREPTGPLPGFVDRQRMHREAAALLERVGAPVSPTQMMGKLSVAAMQAVEIAKAISGGARIVIMDEPTSALSSREVDALFRVIASLRQAGVAIVYISHKMDEIFRIADTITVLRDGCHVATQPAAELDERRLIALMVGRELAPDAARDTGATAKASGPAALSVKNLAKESTFAEISFEVHAGEILGVAGLMGAGRTEVMNALYGFDPADTGDVLVRGRRVDIRHPADAIACGMAMVGEDRKDTGLVQELSIKHNVSLAALRLLSPFGFVDAKRENEAADTSIRTYAIRSASRDQSVSGLSGGNQQKVVIARALLTRPSILILDEPTRGIDIGAKQEVYAMVRRLAADGVAIILVSSELPELLALSHRLLVLREGRLVAELNPASTTQEEILSHAMPRE